MRHFRPSPTNIEAFRAISPIIAHLLKRFRTLPASASPMASRLLLGQIFDFAKYVGRFRLRVCVFVCLSVRDRSSVQSFDLIDSNFFCSIPLGRRTN